MTRSLRTLAIGLALTVGPTLAQEKVVRSVDAVSGKSTRLTVHGDVTKDCKLGPLPEIRITTSPKHGALTVRQGKSKAGSLKRCPNLEVPIQGVFYQANAGYAGSDEVAYTVVRAGQATQAVTVKITVAAQAKPGADKDGGLDL